MLQQQLSSAEDEGTSAKQEVTIVTAVLIIYVVFDVA